jgi:hypothetical protein
MKNLFFLFVLDWNIIFNFPGYSEWICQETMRSDNAMRTIFAYNIVVIHVLSDI